MQCVRPGDRLRAFLVECLDSGSFPVLNRPFRLVTFRQLAGACVSKAASADKPERPGWIPEQGGQQKDPIGGCVGQGLAALVTIYGLADPRYFNPIVSLAEPRAGSP
jgi:hypothetical protein